MAYRCHHSKRPTSQESCTALLRYHAFSIINYTREASFPGLYLLAWPGGLLVPVNSSTRCPSLPPKASVFFSLLSFPYFQAILLQLINKMCYFQKLIQ